MSGSWITLPSGAEVYVKEISFEIRLLDESLFNIGDSVRFEWCNGEFRGLIKNACYSQLAMSENTISVQMNYCVLSGLVVIGNLYYRELQSCRVVLSEQVVARYGNKTDRHTMEIINAHFNDER